MTSIRSGGEDLVANAVIHGIKIWNASKLNSVLARILDLPSSRPSGISRQQNAAQTAATRPTLSHLLQNEKIHGTMERDPAQKRHDYRYFTKGSCFVLIEDMNQELATIAAHEYPLFKEPKNQKENPVKKPWPVLHCHPHSRNPFTPFDEKEKKRWEKQQQADEEEEEERARRKRERQMKAFRKAESKKTGDLRRCVSLNNFKRRHSHPNPNGACIDLDEDDDEDFESANASGYLASGAGMGYVAASGNSVGITSNTGTTSMANPALRNRQLPAAMRAKQHVLTSRKPPVKTKVEDIDAQAIMGPPKVPSKEPPVLKKSKSMNTIKLPKREEGSKPGYCESCRTKFDDFSSVCQSRFHSTPNLANLISVACRVQETPQVRIQPR